MATDGPWKDNVDKSPSSIEEMIANSSSNEPEVASTTAWAVKPLTPEEITAGIIAQRPKVMTDTSDSAVVKHSLDAYNSSLMSRINDPKDNIPPTIARFDRTPVALGNGGTTKFPSDLSEKRYVNIQIYNTIQKDPNAFIADAAGIVVNTAKGFFNGIGKGAEALIGGADATAAIKASGLSVDSFTTAATDAGKTILGSAKEAGTSLLGSMSTFSDVGNPSVGGNGAPVWMDEIWLPLPNDISEALGHNWSEGKGALDTIYDTAKGLIPGGNVMDGGGGGKGFGEVISSITSTSNLVSKMTGTQALTYNENKLIQYTDTEFRTIDLKWTLVPNNKAENETLQSIFVKMKAYSSPQAVASKILLRAPFFCRLKFYNPTLNDALQFDECVITSISLNYSASGVTETFNDDMPKVMELNMTFKDREPKTLQNWAKAQEY